MFSLFLPFKLVCSSIRRGAPIIVQGIECNKVLILRQFVLRYYILKDQ